MEFTPWQLIIDFGIAGALLLAGVVLRAHTGILQRLFLPAAVIAGFLGLAFGPNGADWLPLSPAFGSYPGILIALVFAALPFASLRQRSLPRRLVHLWSYSTIAILAQWGLGIGLMAILLQPLWPGLHPGFGALIAVGFVGGHGTAAAVGQVYADLGWPEAGALAMTSATVGILAAILGGLAWVAWGARSGRARFVTRFDELPQSLRTGLVGRPDRTAVGTETVSPGSIDTLALHFSLIAALAVLSYGASSLGAQLFPAIRLPVFCLAFVFGSVARAVLARVGALDFVDHTTMGHLSGALTDMLVVFGVASISIPVVIAYAGPFALLMVAGIALSAGLFAVLAPRSFDSKDGYWFERALFTWGWTTGVTAMGIALLRIVDPRNDSDTLADFGLVYLFLAPVEIGLLTAVPLLLAAGHSWTLAAGLAGASTGLVVVALRHRS